MKPTLTKPILKKPDAILAFAEGKQTKDAKRVFNAPEGHRRLTINLQEDLHKKLRMAAIEQNCTATDIIVRLLNEDLE